MDMENETQKRKARLMAMRKAATAKSATPEMPEMPEMPETNIWVENDEGSQQKAKSKGISSAEVSGSVLHDTIEASVSGLVEATVAKRQQEVEAQELDIAAIAPKHANWDLKRSLQQRLDRLKAKNEAAVAELISQRIKENNAES
ncbi:hypothetical protein J3B02_003037 [Coemansia erecta]|uniref:Coiled-coil domain-containing protein 12 n=1 Tax=Coemansia asiatica TaxID=1052880 RepID=A0A9W7XLW0_9FUNG|nr:hypothetical protein LPJ64_002572 [Coemansia asiatica]KAJ2853665.1 hypothetical protein J3B02_003037 [Coemansia erecta]